MVLAASCGSWLRVLRGGASSALPGRVKDPVSAVRSLQMLHPRLLTSQVLVEQRDGSIPQAGVGGDDQSRMEMLCGCIWNGIRGVDSASLIPLTCSLFTPHHQHHRQPAEAPPMAVHYAPVQNCKSRSKMAALVEKHAPNPIWG